MSRITHVARGHIHLTGPDGTCFCVTLMTIEFASKVLKKKKNLVFPGHSWCLRRQLSSLLSQCMHLFPRKRRPQPSVSHGSRARFFPRGCLSANISWGNEETQAGSPTGPTLSLTMVLVYSSSSASEIVFLWWRKRSRRKFCAAKRRVTLNTVSR